jgi:hypothetical protein
MTKDKLVDRPVGEEDQNALQKIDTPASAYEASMRVYRWMSKRYRKTLDALAK